MGWVGREVGGYIHIAIVCMYVVGRERLAMIVAPERNTILKATYYY